MYTVAKWFFAITLALLTTSTNASYTFTIDDNNKITFGGFIAADARYVSGDIAYRDFWIGSGTVLENNVAQTKFFANETRFNMLYVHGDASAFIELDFQASPNGNEVISNSYTPRLRHAYINYKNLLVGQTWTTFMNTSSLAETVDFGGPHVAEPFVRNSQIRYSIGAFQLAIENPESYGGDTANDALPDLVAKYTYKSSWGNISTSALLRKLHVDDENSKTTLGYSIAGRINSFGKDDFRFSLSSGQLGRYVGTTVAKDLVNGDTERTNAITLAYRHFWSDHIRSTIFYGNATTKLTDANRSHYGVNIFKNYTPKLSFGFELGVFSMQKDNTAGIDSDNNPVGVFKNADATYGQFKAKFVI